MPTKLGKGGAMVEYGEKGEGDGNRTRREGEGDGNRTRRKA